MKRFFFLALVSLILASCSLHKASIAAVDVYSPDVETITMASLKVMPQKITYRYMPDKYDAKRLKVNQNVQNAIFHALRENGGADELVEVSYYVTMHYGFFGKRVKSILVSGYPAYYTNFREPSEQELKKIEILSNAKMLRQSQSKPIFFKENR